VHLRRTDLETIDLERLRSWASDPADFFSPREHYRLLAYLSTVVPKTHIVDVGTNRGSSALALSYGGSPVHTFDVIDLMGDLPRAPGVTYHRGNGDLLTDAGREQHRELLLESSLIFLDTDPHEGPPELAFVRWLQRNSYRGILVLDDIWYFKGMRDHLWSRIESVYKVDATDLGHWSGTGLVSFRQRLSVEDQVDTSNWTLVTGYFDLTGMSDATPEIQARPRAHYIEAHGGGTLGMDVNLVVFCDPGVEQSIWAMRPVHLHPRTRIIPCDFEKFPLTKYRAKIIENRSGPACRRDPRNTASYYLFCMARYAMVKHAIGMNPFGSTHFGWANICIERMGWQNLARLQEALGVQRDKFSTCFIDYVSKEFAENLPDYFGPGCQSPACGARCSMCSGFFTGRADFMEQVCTMIETDFERCLRAGYGHADEQLMGRVYHQAPELFDWYIGDYAEMITNYAHVRDRPEQPVRNLIANSLSVDKAVCARACDLLLRSVHHGYCQLSESDLTRVIDARA